MTKQNNRRTNYFIKKEFQRKFILKFCGLVVLASLISGIILYNISKGTVTTAFVNSRLSIIRTTDYILPGLLGSSLIAVILTSIATVFVVMYQSHRIAGPLFSLERSVQRLGTGDLTQSFRLRTSDEITSLADCFNEMNKSLKSSIADIQTRADDLSAQIDKLEPMLSSSPVSVQESIKKISKNKEELKKSIAFFKF